MTTEAAVDALQRLLAGPSFVNAEQCRRFLSFVAHETFAGRAHLLNERSIGRLALDRPSDLDTRDDPSVRMLARRVRERLDRHYAREGQKDPVRVMMPVGQYGLTFVLHVPILATGSSEVDGAPVIAITRFSSDGRGSPADRLAAGLSESLVHLLSRFPGVRVAGPLAPSQMSAGSDAVDVGNRTGATFVMSGRVRTARNVIRVQAHLAEAGRGEVVWSGQFDVDGDDHEGFGAEDELVGRMAAAVADHRGAAWRFEPPQGRGPTPSGYRALARYFRFVDTLDPAEGAAAMEELEAARAAEPDNALLVGATASLHSIGVLLRGANGAPESLRAAEALGRRALQLDPQSPFGHGALATTALARGDESSCLAHVSELLDSMPYHPTFLYRAGLLTAGCGRWDEGIAIIERAVRLNPHHPSHQRTLLVIDALRRGDVAVALAHAQLIRFRGSIWAPLCMAMCLNEIGAFDMVPEQIDLLEQEAPDFFDRPLEILSAAPAISLGTASFLLDHVRRLEALRR